MKKTLISLVILPSLAISSCSDGKEQKQAATEKNSETVKYLTAQFSIKPEYVNDFKTFAPGLLSNTRKEDGAVFYKLYQSIEDSTSFIFYEIFKDQAAFDYHLTTEHYKKFAEAMKAMAAKDPELTIIK